MKRKILMIGAHIDDCDIRGGGTALLYREAGFEVTFLSVSNSCRGHQTMTMEETAARRKEEAREITRLTGIRYDIWSDINDCEVNSDLETRKRLVRYIREYTPDVIFTHRPGDYHADHRHTQLLVQDAAYLLGVPSFCPDVPAMRQMPVIVYFYDTFFFPPFVPDVVVPTDAVVDMKYRMYNCHASQVYEWLPFTEGWDTEVPKDAEGRMEWLRSPRVPRDKILTEADLAVKTKSSVSEYREARPAVLYREKIQEQYGKSDVRFAEAFQLSEYGTQLTEELAKTLFPWIRAYTPENPCTRKW